MAGCNVSPGFDVKPLTKMIDMKAFRAIGLLPFIALFSISCKKGVATGLVGRWSIITDSGFEGVGVNNHEVIYTGRPGDYFDFRSDGLLYIREGAALDTLPYKLLSDSTLSIQSFGIILNGVPETDSISLTSSTARISAPVEITPGGQFGRTVDLFR